jgi:hypothetical protein
MNAFGYDTIDDDFPTKEPTKEPTKMVKVDFQTFVEMSQLNVNCLYRTLDGTNKKIDYLYNNLGKELIDITEVRKINNEMEQVQKECQEKFEKLKNNLK